MEQYYLGSNPTNEDCVQVGPYEYLNSMRAELRAYRRGLIKLYGEPPASCRFKIATNPHDFGSYLELVLEFDDQDPEALAYAQRCDSGFEHWSDAGLWVQHKRAADGSYTETLVHELEEPPLAELDGAD